MNRFQLKRQRYRSSVQHTPDNAHITTQAPLTHSHTQHSSLTHIHWQRERPRNTVRQVVREVSRDRYGERHGPMDRETERLTARKTDREETERENRAEERERKTELTIKQQRGAESEEGEKQVCYWDLESLPLIINLEPGNCVSKRARTAFMFF